MSDFFLNTLFNLFQIVMELSSFISPLASSKSILCTQNSNEPSQGYLSFFTCHLGHLGPYSGAAGAISNARVVHRVNRFKVHILLFNV